MIKRLRRRIFVVIALMTAAVVGVMSAIMLGINKRQLQNSYDVVFLNVFEEILGKVRFDSAVGYRWLSETERSNRSVIGISENGKPLFFRGSFVPETDRAWLISEAERISAEQYGVVYNGVYLSGSQPQDAAFSLEGQSGDRYLARVRLLQTGADSYASIVLLMDLSEMNRETVRLEKTYAVIVAAAMAALLLISRIAASLAVGPARRSIERQNEFIASASHELRSPLAVMQAGLSVARQEENQESLFPLMEREILRMARLVDDLLSLARSDAAGWSVSEGTVDLEMLVLETVEQMTPYAAKKGHRIEVAVPKQLLPKIRGDAVRLAQVLGILIHNACDYAERTPVTLSVKLQKRAAVISVIDRGAGIPDREKKKVFDRFYRGDQSRTDKEHFGLGLSIARELIRLHGGSIRAEDTPGGGAAFVIRLPLS